MSPPRSRLPNSTYVSFGRWIVRGLSSWSPVGDPKISCTAPDAGALCTPGAPTTRSPMPSLLKSRAASL
jgi:hypothetical protein